ncbi:MAG: hypothetical protein M5R37_01445 [Melioribacteraceae bacterium]|nr:hypothetical protein [Melioribacteraceae bacterium]
MNILIVLLGMINILSLILTPLIAWDKNRSSFGWFLLALFFPIIPLAIILILPQLKSTELSKEEKNKIINDLKNIKSLSKKERSRRLIIILTLVFLFVLFLITLDYLRHQ